MGRAPCCEKVGLKKGPWSSDEDQILIRYITLHGHGNWRALPKKAGLMRCGKSCRLRWINYLRPDIKRGNFTRDEEDTIVNLHQTLGNRWSAIAARLPGRTDNEIKNVWHTHLKKRFNTTKPQQHTNKETSSSSINVDNNNNIIEISQPVTTTSATASRDCNHHMLDLSPQPCSSITDDMSFNRSLQTTCHTNNELVDIVEPFWSEVLSEGTMMSSSIVAEEPFQLSPISGFGIMGEKGGFVGCGYDNVMEFWNEGLDRCEDYFAPNNMF